MRDGQQRTRCGRYALDALLAFAREGEHAVGREFRFGQLIPRGEGLRGFYFRVDQLVRNDLASGITRVAFKLVRIIEQTVAKQRLCFSVDYRCGRKFLLQARRILRDVSKVCSVATLVKQCGDGTCAAADLIGLGAGGEVVLAGHPSAFFVKNEGIEPWQKPFWYFPLRSNKSNCMGAPR